MITLKYFRADWCGPCAQQGPIVSEIGDERDDVEVEKIDVEENNQAANKHQVRGLPTIILINEAGGRERMTGFTDRDTIEQKIDTL